jgi:hypothetical protein
VAKRSPGAGDPHDRGVAIGLVPFQIVEIAKALVDEMRGFRGALWDSDRAAPGTSAASNAGLRRRSGAGLCAPGGDRRGDQRA